jgi:hypothetical protein
MMAATDEIVGFNLDPLPLKTYTNIHEGNALRMDWNEVVPASELNYIMGNPPFVGARIMSADQKDDLISVFGAKWKNIGNMDYVTGWYKKSQEMMQVNPSILAALVSTNSITQGEQVANLWRPLMAEGVHIDFAWRTFIWDSEASQKAHVHCVIVGFSVCHSERKLRIYEGKKVIKASNINAYLIDGETIFVESRSIPLCDVPEIGIGNKPIDGGFYLFKDEKLILGPFQGLVACTEIPVGKGVCGKVAATKEVEIVPNVHEFPGHIACDSRSNSEIVLPIFLKGNFYGELDIDSTSFERFNEVDKVNLLEFVKNLQKDLERILLN